LAVAVHEREVELVGGDLGVGAGVVLEGGVVGPVGTIGRRLEIPQERPAAGGQQDQARGRQAEHEQPAHRRDPPRGRSGRGIVPRGGRNWGIRSAATGGSASAPSGRGGTIFDWSYGLTLIIADSGAVQY